MGSAPCYTQNISAFPLISKVSGGCGAVSLLVASPKRLSHLLHEPFLTYTPIWSLLSIAESCSLLTANPGVELINPPPLPIVCGVVF